MIVENTPVLETPEPKDPVEALKFQLSPHAKLITRKDGVVYDEARKVFNGDVNKTPRYIVKVAGVADVIQCIKFSEKEKIPISIRCAGHSARGDSVVNDGLVICGSLLRHCRVDPVAKTATAQQGCLLGDIDHETNAFGLCVPGLGTASITGCMGLTLGGGQGWLSRKYGLAVDNVIAAEMVLADGSFVKCSQTENSDLFWAIRGGGGRFGVVTSLTYNCIPTPQINITTVIWPFEAKSALSIVTEYCEWSGNFPNEAGAFLFLNVVPLPNGPQPVIMLVAVHQGTVEEGKKLFEPFSEKVNFPSISNTTVAMEYINLQKMLDNLTHPGTPLYNKSGYIQKQNITQEFLKDFVETFSTRTSDTTILGIYNICCGGAVSSGKWNASYPSEYRNASQVVLTHAGLESNRDECIQWVKDVHSKFPLFGTYINSSAEDDTPEKCFLDNVNKMRQIKTKYDPNNLFGNL